MTANLASEPFNHFPNKSIGNFYSKFKSYSTFIFKSSRMLDQDKLKAANACVEV